MHTQHQYRSLPTLYTSKNTPLRLTKSFDYSIVAVQIKELIKKEFHIVGTKYPRWVQGGEWPVSKSGKPMRFVEQKRKKGKEYQDVLYTIYVFEDLDTLEKRIIEQFT